MKGMKLNNLFALIFCVFFASAAFGQQLVFDPKGEKDCIDDCTSDYSVQLEILGAFIDETTSPYSGTPVFNLTLTDEYGNLAEFGSIEFDLEITNYFDDQEVDFENTFTTAGYSQNGCGAFMVQACNIQTMESTVTFYQDLGDFSQLSNNDPIGVNGQGTLVQPGGGTLEPIYAVYTPPVFNDRNLRCPIGYNITISNIVFNDANCDSAFGTGSYPDWYGTAEVYCVEGSVSGSYTYYPQNDNTSDCGGNGGNGRIANSDISDKVQLFPIFDCNRHYEI